MLDTLQEWLTPSRIYWTAAILLSAVAILRAITRGLGVERTLLWLLAIIAFPGVGAVGYFIFATPSIKRSKMRKRRSSVAVRQRLSHLHPPGNATAYSLATPEPCRTPLTPAERGMLRLCEALTGLTPSQGNDVELLSHDEGAFKRLEDAARAAKKFIWAEYYIIKNDETGHRFLDLLAEQAGRGIEVRLIYDAFGSLWLDAARLKRIEQNGGFTASFLPVNPLRRKWAIHLRNHRKMVIVDGEFGATGGMNVGDEYSGRARRRGDWHFLDSQLALRGPAVADLAQTFLEDWFFATEEQLDMPPIAAPLAGATATVAVVPSGPDQEHNANAWVYFGGIAQAKRRVYLQTPYFVPNEPTWQALAAAALRGADVRLVVPAKNDVPLIGAAMRSYFRPLVQCGVRIYEYLPAMLHAKTIVVDASWAIVGSANVDVRSFRLNFELGALVVDLDFAAILEARFLADLDDCREVTLKMLDEMSFLGRLRDGAARLLSPLL